MVKTSTVPMAMLRKLADPEGCALEILMGPAQAPGRAHTHRANLLYRLCWRSWLSRLRTDGGVRMTQLFVRLVKIT